MDGHGNASWLHLATTNGTGSANVIFTCDANSGAARTGTITLTGLTFFHGATNTLTITQAGATYVQAPGPVTALVSSGLNTPIGVAVDAAGNVYISDFNSNAIKKWSASNNTVSNVVSSGLNKPVQIALDGAGNIYIADSANQAVEEWVVASNTMVTLVSSGLNTPVGVAVDSAGNVYIADLFNNAIKKWTAANSNVTTLVSSGLYYPGAVAVDAAGNVYIADSYNNAIKEWNPANNTVSTLVSSGLNNPNSVAVDGSGNVYFSDSANNAIKKWTAASNSVSTLISSANNPNGTAVDGAGNVYFTSVGNNLVGELPRVFVDPTPKVETFGAGSDALPPVLPTTANLLPPFAPTSDQPWLTIAGTSGGVVNFSYSLANSNRTGHVTVLGQTVAVSQVLAVNNNATVTNGYFQVGFTNYIPNASYNVLSTTNLAAPLANWIEVDAAFNLPTGYYQFAIPVNTNNSRRFYRLHLIQ